MHEKSDVINIFFAECAVDEFKCDLSRCIPKNQICDGRYDCSDKTDEHNCKPGKNTFIGNKHPLNIKIFSYIFDK